MTGRRCVKWRDAKARDPKRHVPAPIALERRAIAVVLVAVELDDKPNVQPHEIDLALRGRSPDPARGGG
jgi:hypothetical protein